MTPHQFKTETRDQGFCDDHYCTGHSEKYLVCSCGWEERLYDTLDSDKNNLNLRLKKMEHRLDELEGGLDAC